MTIVITNNVVPKVVAVMGSIGIFMPSVEGEGAACYVSSDGYIDPRPSKSLASLADDAAFRTVVYEGSTVVIEPGKGFTVEHAPVRDLVGVLSDGSVGIYVEHQGRGTAFMNPHGKVVRVYPEKTLQEALDESSCRTPVFAGATISFEL